MSHDRKSCLVPAAGRPDYLTGQMTVAFGWRLPLIALVLGIVWEPAVWAMET